jgi:hypothetical protein
MFLLPNRTARRGGNASPEVVHRDAWEKRSGRWDKWDKWEEYD